MANPSKPSSLSFSNPVLTSVSPEMKTLSLSVPVVTENRKLLQSKKLSYRKFQPVEMVPGARNDHTYCSLLILTEEHFLPFLSVIFAMTTIRLNLTTHFEITLNPSTESKP